MIFFSQNSKTANTRLHFCKQYSKLIYWLHYYWAQIPSFNSLFTLFLSCVFLSINQLFHITQGFRNELLDMFPLIILLLKRISSWNSLSIFQIINQLMSTQWKMINVSITGFYLASIYLPKINNGNTRTICKISSKLTIKTPQQHLVSLLLVLNIFHTLFWCYLWTSNYWMGFTTYCYFYLLCQLPYYNPNQINCMLRPLYTLCVYSLDLYPQLK